MCFACAFSSKRVFSDKSKMAESGSGVPGDAVVAGDSGSHYPLRCPIGEFDPKSEEVGDYLERFELFVDINLVTEPNRQNISWRL